MCAALLGQLGYVLLQGVRNIMLVSPKQTVVHFRAPKCREVGEVHDVFCASTEQAVKASVFLRIAYNLRVLEMRLVGNFCLVQT